MGRDDDRNRKRRSRSREDTRRKRSRSRERSKRDRSRSRSPNDRRSKRDDKSSKDTNLDVAAIIEMKDRNAAEKLLEAEMLRRRERIVRLRDEKKRQDMLTLYAAKYDNDQAEKLVAEEMDKLEKEREEMRRKQQGSSVKIEGDDSEDVKDKSWSMADDIDNIPEDEEELTKPAVKIYKPGDDDSDKSSDKTVTIKKEEMEVDDDVDPLDAYMKEVNDEVRKIRAQKPKPVKGKGGKVDEAEPAAAPSMEGDRKTQTKIVTIIRGGVAEDNRGDIVEQHDDAPENYNISDTYENLSGRLSLETKGRQLAMTDHSKVYYRPFRRDFYREVPELARMTQEEVDAYRVELEGIQVRGKNCPKPIKNWAHAGMQQAVMHSLKALKYEKPTPIQAQAIPAILSGRDIIGIAKTGSGKTLAFLLPMFRHIMDQDELDEMDGPIALIISPTRELATQTATECKKFAKNLNLRVVCIYGGAPITDQIAELKRGAEIVICAPGRMIEMLAANSGRVTNLRRVTYLVLDEADRMFDAGFEPQIMRIIANIRPDHQTVLFSATFPRSMEALARKVLHKPIEIQVGGRSVVCSDIEQKILVVSDADKFPKLLELLGVYWEYGNVLVFSDKQEHCDDLVGDLMKAGYNCAPLHAAIDQYDRDSTIIDFKSGKLKLLVATGVAARGLDVKKLILVVNYDCPNHYEEYVHRVGRTGRAGNKGYAYTFILPEGQDKYAPDMVRALEESKQPIPEELQKICDRYKTTMAAEGKQVKASGGFGGHGFKFDVQEDEAEKLKKGVEKLARGIDVEDDDDIEAEINRVLKAKKNMKTTPGHGSSVGAPNMAALEKAKEAARKLVLGAHEKTTAQLTAEAMLRGESKGYVPGAGMTSKVKAAEIGLLLNEKLNYTPQETETVNAAESQFRVYEEELEINDFPQIVRYKLCSREVMNLIQEDPEVGLTPKGNHYPGNRAPPEGDRKLYLFLEATNEMSLNRAKGELVRIIKECFQQLAIQNQRQGPVGRYKVV